MNRSAFRSVALSVMGALLAVLGRTVEAASTVGATRLAVTSNTVLADLVANVAEGKFQVRALAPAGTDPHTFQPTPESIKILSQARVVFFNGAGLEEWWDKTIQSVAKPAVPVVELSKGLATIRMPGYSQSGHSHPEGRDPHVWLDPSLVKAYCERIRDALSQVDRANTGFYADRAKAYQAKLEEKDMWGATPLDQLAATAFASLAVPCNLTLLLVRRALAGGAVTITVGVLSITRLYVAEALPAQSDAVALAASDSGAIVAEQEEPDCCPNGVASRFLDRARGNSVRHQCFLPLSRICSRRGVSGGGTGERSCRRIPEDS